MESLQCKCNFTESCKTLQSQVDKIEAHISAKSHKKALQTMKQTLTHLEELRVQHETYWQNLTRSQCEFSKHLALMPADSRGYNESVIRTSAWRAGDLYELRRPVKRKKKKKQQQQQEQKQPHQLVQDKREQKKRGMSRPIIARKLKRQKKEGPKKKNTVPFKSIRKSKITPVAKNLYPKLLKKPKMLKIKREAKD